MTGGIVDIVDKDAFPSLDREVQEKRVETTFLRDFTIAERLGTDMVKEAFDIAFRHMKGDCRYLVELTVVMNKLCWRAYERGDAELSRWYADRFYQCRDWAFRDGSAFTEDEQAFFIDVID